LDFQTEGRFDLEKNLLESHIRKLRPDDVAILKATADTGDVDILLQWYVGATFLEAVKPLFYASARNLFILGSWGSGKTTNLTFWPIADCLTNSFYKFVNLGPVSRQASLMFRNLRAMLINNDRIEHLVKKVREAPYPFVEFWNGSTCEFLTAKPEFLDYLQGEEFDHANIDECALLIDFARTVGLVRSRLRGVRQRTGVDRACLLSCTTVPGYDPELKERYERGLTDNPDYLSIKLLKQHNPYFSEEQLRLMMQDVTASDERMYIQCEWPEARGRLIPALHYNACESVELMLQMDDLIKNNVMGALYEEMPRIGVTHWELPRQEGHRYLVVGDPGFGDPPKRGAGVVMGWDVTEPPYDMVYFDWVFGGGSIGPWCTSFTHAARKYPGEKAFDSTGSQKEMDELYFEREGIIVYPLSFTRHKWGMLNSLLLLLEQHGVRYPFIQGMKGQCMRYALPDKKLDQDLVAGLMMSAWMIRPARRMEEPEREGLPFIGVKRGYRGSRTVGRRTR